MGGLEVTFRHVRPVSTGANGSNGSTAPYVMYDSLMDQELSRSLVRPHFEAVRNFPWAAREEELEKYFSDLGKGNGISEANKLKLFSNCCDEQLQSEINQLTRMNPAIGFTQVFHQLKQQYAPIDDFAARKRWAAMKAPCEGRVSYVEFRNFRLAWQEARRLVGHTSEEEALRVLYEALPVSLSGPTATEEDKVKSKNPLVIISGLVDPTVDGVRNSLQAMVPEAQIVSIQITGPDQVSMRVKKREQANAFLILDGRRPRNGTRPLKIEVRPAQVTVDHMFDHLEQYLRVGDRRGDINSHGAPPKAQKPTSLNTAKVQVSKAAAPPRSDSPTGSESELPRSKPMPTPVVRPGRDQAPVRPSSPRPAPERVGKGGDRPRSYNSARVKCWNCGELGHTALQCEKPRDEARVQKALKEWNEARDRALSNNRPWGASNNTNNNNNNNNHTDWNRVTDLSLGPVKKAPPLEL